MSSYTARTLSIQRTVSQPVWPVVAGMTYVLIYATISEIKQNIIVVGDICVNDESSKRTDDSKLMNIIDN
jgi:hypothetical protein